MPRSVRSKLVCTGLLGVTTVIAGKRGDTHAEELVTPLLAGVTIGAPLGKAPPPGTYAGTTVLYLRGVQVDGAGRRTDLALRELEVAQSLLVATDYRFLGARYSISAVQPVKRTESTILGATRLQTGAYNTILSPLNLSWEVGADLFVSYGHTFYLPDGTYSALGPKVANGFFTFEQNAAVSYSRGAYALTANLNLDLNALNANTGYRSGDVVGVDVAATRSFGRLALGLGGYLVDQFGDDRVAGKPVSASRFGGRGNRWREIALGPYASYDFGGLTVATWYTQDVLARNTVKAGAGWLRVAVPVEVTHGQVRR